MPTSDWDNYRAFLAVFAEGSLTAAARAIDSSAPTLGRHVEALEASLGLALFTRSPSGLAPTAAALEIEPYARAMGAAATALERVASGTHEGDRGAVRITASEIVAIEVLPPMLARFRRTHGAIDIEMAVNNDTEDLLRRDADIALRMVRPVQEALIAQRVGAVNIGLYVHRQYAERYGLPSSMEDVSEHALIGFDRGANISKLAQKIGLDLHRGMFAFRSDNDLAQLAALRAGFGIGGCQTIVAASLPDLVPVLEDRFRLQLEVWLVMHRDQRNVRRVRLLFDHLAAELGAYLANGG